MTATIGAPVIGGARWDPPAAIAVRGTVLLIPGRGEHAGVYDRFGRRLAADGYAVRSVTPATALAQAADAVAPVVLAGSDTGALHALALATAAPFAGVIAAGITWGDELPAGDRTGPEASERGSEVDRPEPLGGWDGELAARSACPTHQARLTGDPGFRRGTLDESVADELRRAVDPTAVAVPVLVVHGAADPVAPVQGARALAAALPHAELATVRDGRHDAPPCTQGWAARSCSWWCARTRPWPPGAPPRSGSAHPAR